MRSDLPMSGKKGPIYSVEWNPNSEEFCVVYGCILVLDVQGYLYQWRRNHGATVKKYR